MTGGLLGILLDSPRVPRAEQISQVAHPRTAMTADSSMPGTLPLIGDRGNAHESIHGRDRRLKDAPRPRPGVCNLSRYRLSCRLL